MDSLEILSAVRLLTTSNERFDVNDVREHLDGLLWRRARFIAER